MLKLLIIDDHECKKNQGGFIGKHSVIYIIATKTLFNQTGGLLNAADAGTSYFKNPVNYES